MNRHRRRRLRRAIIALAPLVGLTVMPAGTEPAPSCYEDEVIMWTGEDHDLCVPIDTLVAVVDTDQCRAINPDDDDAYECAVMHLDQRSSHFERDIADPTRKG